MSRRVPGGRTNQPYALTKEHKELLLELFIGGYTLQGIRSRMLIYNEQAAQTGATPFPDVCVATITYHRRKMKEQIAKAINDEIAQEEFVERRGLRYRDERIKRLEYAAEVLEPYLGHANIKGQFSASEQYVNILKAIREECEPIGRTHATSSLDPAVIKSLPLDIVKKLAAEYKNGA